MFSSGLPGHSAAHGDVLGSNPQDDISKANLVEELKVSRENKNKTNIIVMFCEHFMEVTQNVIQTAHPLQ